MYRVFTTKLLYVLTEKKWRWGVRLSAGSLLGASLLHPYLWPLVFVGAALSLYCFTKTNSWWETVLTGWFIGSAKIAVSSLWFWSTYPLDWMGIKNGPLQALMISIYWLPAALTLGSGLAIFAFVYKKYLHRLNIYIGAVLTGGLLVLSEVLGAVVFSIYTMGPGSSVTVGFSFGQVGYALAHHGLFAHVANFSGVYGLSFLVGMLSVLMIRNKNKNNYFIIIFILVSFFLPNLTDQTEPVGKRVALIETSLPIFKTETPFTEQIREDVLFDAVDSALLTGADYIILPEDSRFTSYFSNFIDVVPYLKSRTDNDVVLIDSARTEIAGVTTLRAYIYDSSADEIFAFDKQYLVPQGEYVPYVYQSLISLFDPSGKLLSSIQDTVYRHGLDQADLKLPDNIPNILFCFESVTPFGVRDSVGRRKDTLFIAHIVSHAWFNREPEILWHQLDAMLVTQARFNNLPILQASNQARAKVYLPNGDYFVPLTIESNSKWQVSLVEL